MYYIYRIKKGENKMKEFKIGSKTFRIGYDNLIDLSFGYHYNKEVDFTHEFLIGRFFICWD